MNQFILGAVVGAALGAAAYHYYTKQPNTVSGRRAPGTAGTVHFADRGPVTAGNNVSYGVGFGPRPDWSASMHNTPSQMGSLSARVV